MAYLDRVAAEKLLQDPYLKETSLAELAQSSLSDIRCKVAGHQNTPFAILESLLKDENKSVVMAVFSNPSLDQKFVQQAIASGKYELALSCPSLPQDQLYYIWESIAVSVRQAAIHSPQSLDRTPGLVPTLPRQIFSHPNCPDDLRAQLMSLYGIDIARLAVFVPSMSAKMLDMATRVALDAWCDKRFYLLLVKHPNCSGQTLDLLFVENRIREIKMPGYFKNEIKYNALQNPRLSLAGTRQLIRGKGIQHYLQPWLEEHEINQDQLTKLIDGGFTFSEAIALLKA